MKTITFYSYKGGVGRTLVVANIATYLATFGKKVLAIDFDLEAPGLHYKFGLGEGDAGVEVKLGLVDILANFETEGRLPECLSDYVVQIPAREDMQGQIFLLPAGIAPRTDYWQRLSRVSWHDLFYCPGAKGIPLFLELKERIRDQYSPDFLLIDSRTGITEIGGVATTILPEQVVCFVLNNRENLEGAREVLRSIKRTPRLPNQSPVDIVAVVTRIPMAEDSQPELSITDEVRRFLNEEASELQDTLQVAEVLVLHSEPALELAEALRIGSGIKPEDSILLRDYLRLFSRLFSPDLLGRNVDELIKRVFTRVLDDPEGTERELEALVVSCPHPDVYRALLKFYRLRQRGSKQVLRTACNLWETTGDASDPLLWDAVETSITALSERLSRREEFPVPLEFIEAVWRGAGASNPEVGFRLADLYLLREQRQRVGPLLLSLVENQAYDEGTVVRTLSVLSRTGDWDTARRIIETCKSASKGSIGFQVAWAQSVMARGNPAEALAILEDADFDVETVQKVDAALAAQVFLRTGHRDRAELLLDAAFAQSAGQDRLGRMGMEDAVRIGQVFAELGRLKEFEMRLEGVLGDQESVERIMTYVREQRPRSGFRRPY